MPRKNRTDQELGWLCSAWEELAQTELTHAGRVTITIIPAAMRSRFYVQFEFVRPISNNDLPPMRCVEKLTYPAPDATSFLMWLWNRSRLFGEYVDNDDAANKEQLYKPF